MKHTPGPWHVGELCGGCINIEADTTPRHVTVGRVHVFGLHVEAEANARLIAEAPALLDALRDLVRRADTTSLEDGSNLDTAQAHAILARIDGE